MSDRSEIVAEPDKPRRPRWGRRLRVPSAFVGTAVLFHVGVVFAVLPYVYVSDDAANCGARMLLAKDVRELWQLFEILFGFGIASLGAEIVFDIFGVYFMGVPEYAKESIIIVPLSVMVLAVVLMFVDDTAFVGNLPPLPQNVKACAHPDVG